MKYIDIHCHLNHEKYNDDIQEVIDRTREVGIGMIVVGTDLESSNRAIEIAERNPDIWATVGLHPSDIEIENFDMEIYKSLAVNKRVVAIGECGLDYTREGFLNKSSQIAIFEKHIDIANELSKPLMLHIRNGSNIEHNAYKDALEIIKRKAKIRGNVHFFAGSVVEAREFVGLGYTLSFTGVITFTNDYDEVIKSIPLSSIMSETDAPFVSPVPYRGKRNEPSHVVEVVKRIAEIKGESMDVVAQSIIDNARKIFSIQ